jgi:hypothetical protein
MDTFTTAGPAELAAFYHDVTDPNARAVLDFLIDHAGQRYTAREIMTALGFAQHRDVARAAYAVGEAAGRHGLARPWNEAQLGYMMSPETTSLLRGARGHAG